MKKYFVIGVTLLYLFCSCNDYKSNCTEYRECATKIFYDDLSVKKKLSLIKELNKSKTQDTIDAIALESMLETLEGKNELSNRELIKDSSLYKFALRDSMKGYNIIFLSYYVLGDNFYPQMTYAAEYIMQDKTFLTKTHSYVDPSGLILPMDTVLIAK